ncbi:penicillin-insensitive murein endopeptidase [Persicimonas caeni]|nr:penicillin-insensitive murein endopeptidase [Persicimonas caeni]
MAPRLNTSKYIVSGTWIALLALAACGTSHELLQSGQSAEAARSQPASVAEVQLEAEEPEVRVIEREPTVDLAPAKAAASKALGHAVNAAGERVVGWWKPLPEQPDFAKLLDPKRQFIHSLSLGTVGRGELRNAARIPEDGDHHSVIERHRNRNTQFGSEALIEVILDSAKVVSKAYPGSKLRIGNMSRKHGGDIPWSASHNSGRDADLAFFCKTKKDGKPVLAPGLLDFDSSGDGIKRPDLVFDVERNWKLVEALLSHERVHIQWLFISEGLKKLLLDHARAQGADEEIIKRAEKVLHQPTDSSPHDDHFHLRITCPKRDRLEGCLDFGPRWEWVDWHYDDLLARSMAVARAFRAPKEETRIRALDFLERIRSPYAPELALAAALHEKSDKVRKRALEVAKDVPIWSGAAVGAALRFVERSEFSLEEKAYAYSVIRRAADTLAVDRLKKRIADTELAEAERVMAARSLIHLMEPELVPFLLQQLETQPDAVRAELAVALRRVTNRAENVDWEKASDDARAKALASWKKWWKDNGDKRRDDWLEEGFIAHGLEADDVFTVDAVDELIPMLKKGPEHVAYNANLTLKRVTGRWAPLEAWSHARLHRYWSRWWRSVRQRMVAAR